MMDDVSFGNERLLSDTVPDYNNNASSSSGGNNNSNSNNNQQQAQGSIDLVTMVPFDVQISLLSEQDISLISPFEVTNTVTDWMNGAMELQLAVFGYTTDNGYARLESLVLTNLLSRRWLHDVDLRSLQGGPDKSNNNDKTPSHSYTAQFKGTAFFTRDDKQTKSVPAEDVLVMQRLTLLNDTALRTALQQSTASGLGNQVLDVNAYLNPNSTSAAGSNSSSSSSTNSDLSGSQLEIVIVVAIAVAAIAFLFLTLAIVWAWRHDRRNRHAYLVSQAGASRGGSKLSLDRPDKTGSDTTMDEELRKSASPDSQKSNPVVLLNRHPMDRFRYRDDAVLGTDLEIGASGMVYPESIISDDISTSLSQYYRSGMGTTAGGGGVAGTASLIRRTNSGSNLNDAASVSSMESYGYSLDGYGTTNSVVAEAVAPNRPQANSHLESIGGLPIEPAQAYYYDDDDDDDDGDDDDDDHRGLQRQDPPAMVASAMASSSSNRPSITNVSKNMDKSYSYSSSSQGLVSAVNTSINNSTIQNLSNIPKNSSVSLPNTFGHTDEQTMSLEEQTVSLEEQTVSIEEKTVSLEDTGLQQNYRGVGGGQRH